MGRRKTRRLRVALLMLACSASPPVIARDRVGSILEQVGRADQLAEAKILLEAADYEGAQRELDRLIARFGDSPETAADLDNALELRAAVRFSLNDSAGAQADFQALLTRNPDYAPSSPIMSPRILAFFDEVRRLTTARMRIVPNPPDAEVRIDSGKASSRSEFVPVLAGAHRVTVERPGYETLSLEIDAPAGSSQETPIILRRIAAVVTLVTAPTGAEVYVQGSGDTSPQRKGLTPDNGVLRLVDLKPGRYVAEFRKPCYASKQVSLDIEELKDYDFNPIGLDPATGVIAVESTTPGTAVLLDGKASGNAPVRLADVCEGVHQVELRSQYGRYATRVELHPQDVMAVRGLIKPAFGLMAVGSNSSNVPTNQLLADVERALGSVQSVSFFTPSKEDLGRVSAIEAPVSLFTQAAQGTETQRQRSEWSSRAAGLLESQGVAVMIPTEPSARSVRISLFFRGSGDADNVEFSLRDQGSIQKAVRTLNTSIEVLRFTTGVVAIDVLDQQGPVVGAVETSETSGIARGDVIMSAGDRPVRTVADFLKAVSDRHAAGVVPVEVRDGTGVVKQLQLKIRPQTRVISFDDHALPFNKLAVDFGLQSATATEVGEKAAARLNLAVALMRLGDMEAAARELTNVSLPSGSGVSQGTVEYLLGVCYEALGRRAESEQAWKRASTHAGSELTEDGPTIKELLDRKLPVLPR
jgi:tetratricopeptide (TPR) repeat protein